MAIARREFLRASAAVAALVVADCGCESLSVHPPAQPSGDWEQLPGILARIVPPSFPDRDYLVTDYGASGDGKSDCYRAFAAAITACNSVGGGRVVVPTARQSYLVNGPIHLLSNVNLYLDAGAEVRFGANPSDYLPVVQVRYQGIRCYNYSPLIYAYQQTNIAITGSGTFSGPADSWSAWVNLANPDWALLEQMAAEGVPVGKRIFGAGHYLRLTMFEPYDCGNILLQGVTLRGSPFWTIHPTFCTNVTIQNVTVQPGFENDDGCDPDSCADVLIEGCRFTTNDDNVSVKAGYGQDAQGLPLCENIVIQNCDAISTNWGGITIGSQTGSTVQSVFVQNCRVGPCSSAFFIKSSSAAGGAAKSIFIRSCEASKCEGFLRIQSDYGGGYGPTPPLFTNINLENMSCDDVSGIAFAIDGDARNPVLNVSLSDIAIGSASSVQQVENALFIDSSNVTVGGQPVTISGLL
ncbi:MAG: glycoside hydrolase family 28 protein [Terracidiphilus sp.]